MSYFSASLDRIMGERKLTQTELSKRAQVHQGQLSRYLNAEARPDVEGLERLCTALGDDGAALLASFLQDEIPEKMRGLVEVVTVAAPARPPEDAVSHPPAYSRLGRRERQLIDDLAEGFERSPGLVNVIESALALVRER